MKTSKAADVINEMRGLDKDGTPIIDLREKAEGVATAKHPHAAPGDKVIAHPTMLKHLASKGFVTYEEPAHEENEED